MVPVKARWLRTTLRPGTVYFMPHRGLTSPLAHFLVVVNRDPLSDELLVLSVITSNIAFRREQAEAKGWPPETVVEFGPADYPELAHPSCIDCNKLHTMSAGEFEQAVRTRFAVPKDDLPPPVLSRVIAGILASTAVKEDFKALVRP